jgi:hypothetical protein
MFRPISGHPQVHSWFLKHTEEEVYTYTIYISPSIYFKDQL